MAVVAPTAAKESCPKNLVQGIAQQSRHQQCYRAVGNIGQQDWEGKTQERGENRTMNQVHCSFFIHKAIISAF